MSFGADFLKTELPSLSLPASGFFMTSGCRLCRLPQYVHYPQEIRFHLKMFIFLRVGSAFRTHLFHRPFLSTELSNVVNGRYQTHSWAFKGREVHSHPAQASARRCCASSGKEETRSLSNKADFGLCKRQAGKKGDSMRTTERKLFPAAERGLTLART